MYSKIVDPTTRTKVLINTLLGKQILRNYLNVVRGGAAGGAVVTGPSVNDLVVYRTKTRYRDQVVDNVFRVVNIGSLGQHTLIELRDAINPYNPHTSSPWIPENFVMSTNILEPVDIMQLVKLIRVLSRQGVLARREAEEWTRDADVIVIMNASHGPDEKNGLIALLENTSAGESLLGGRRCMPIMGPDHIINKIFAVDNTQFQFRSLNKEFLIAIIHIIQPSRDDGMSGMGGDHTNLWEPSHWKKIISEQRAIIAYDMGEIQTMVPVPAVADRDKAQLAALLYGAPVYNPEQINIGVPTLEGLLGEISKIYKIRLKGLGREADLAAYMTEEAARHTEEEQQHLQSLLPTAADPIMGADMAMAAAMAGIVAEPRYDAVAPDAVWEEID